MKIISIMTVVLGFVISFFWASFTFAYQEQPIFNTGKSWSSASTRGLIWTNWDGFSSDKVEKITLALANGDSEVTWRLYCANKALNQFRSSDYITVTEADFYTFTFEDNFAENDLYYCYLTCKSGTKNCGSSDYAWHLDMFGANYNVNPQVQTYGGDASPVIDYYFELYTTEDIAIPFEITNPDDNSQVIDDSFITVSGTCPVNGENRIGFTDDCLGFEDIQYTTACVENEFSAQFYHTSLSDRVIAREIDSVSGDCVDYDNLMDFVTVDGIDFVDGYPQDWYFNFGIYEDYNIHIKSSSFDTALTLPKGSTSKDFTFGFTYPDGTIDNLTFNIRQYNSDGDLLNENFHTRTLASMVDTSDYTVTMSASTTPYHYVVQLLESGTLKRQYPFGIYVSDLDFVGNPDDDGGYFFPRIVEELRKKIVFNYYFAFHDGFYDMFNGQYSSPAPDALDITFKSVSGNDQYDIDVKIFSASDPRVKSFAGGMRPYIVAIIWLVFAMYVVFRVTHLFSDNE